MHIWKNCKYSCFLFLKTNDTNRRLCFQCPYSHNTKSEPCIHFNGPGKRCSYGDRCRFSHSTDLSKFDRESLEARLSQLSKRMETLPSTTVSGPVVYSNLAETVI